MIAASGLFAAEFERDILPLLERRCAQCHSGTAAQAGFDIRTRASLVKGGKSGAAISPGDPDSLLLRRVAAGQMPPGAKLPAAEIELLRDWIRQGAAAADPNATAADLARRHWAFQPPVQPEIPKVRAAARVRTPVDAFVIAALEKKGGALRPDAGRGALLRRVTFDLTGLPPTPEEADAFEADTAPDAYDRVVERLLASERYGERQARHWLDAAGYADSEGVLAADVVRANAWRYRDYVIRAFNKDKPFDVFVREQLAGDEFSDFRKYEKMPPEVVEAVEATGFLRTAVDATREDFQPKDFAEYQWRTYFDTQQIVASSLMGITMHCARCHDHKYEPLTQRDYYSMLAVFAGALRPEGPVLPSYKRLIHDAAKSEQARAETVNKPLDDILKALRDLRAARVKQYRALHEKRDKATEAELRAAFPAFAEAAAALDKEIERETTRRVDLPTIRAIYDLDSTAPPSYVFLRGDPTQHGDPVAPGVPAVLDDPARPFSVPKPDPSASTTGRRAAFATWLTSPGHPLTARVMVNRVWAGHFGEGLVPTMDNFGKSGPSPSNRELLDWLATGFVRQGWSVKALHRTIVKSSFYRQTSNMPRRLEAEAVRDAVLAASGTLDAKMYGEPVGTRTKTTGEVAPAGEDCKGRRSIYQIVRRSAPQSFLASFDAPVMEINCSRRVTSASASQALAMMNGDFAAAQAGHFANRVLKRNGDDRAAAVDAFRLALTRKPSPREIDDLLSFVKSQAAHYPEMTGVALRWQVFSDLAQALLSANEFIYID